MFKFIAEAAELITATIMLAIVLTLTVASAIDDAKSRTTVVSDNALAVCILAEQTMSTKNGEYEADASEVEEFCASQSDL